MHRFGEKSTGTMDLNVRGVGEGNIGASGLFGWLKPFRQM